MPGLTSIRFLRLLLVLVVIVGLSSCMVYRHPRSGAYVSPAPSAVVDYDYWYYPGVQVYFDINRRIYFYYDNNRWIQTRVLPPYWRNRLHEHVRIKSRHQRPYLEYNEHVHRYPSRYRDNDRYDRRNDRRERDEYRAKQPRVIQTIPRKEPRSRPYREEHYQHTPPKSNSRVKVPSRERYEERQYKKHEIKSKAKERVKNRNKHDKDSEGDDKGYDRRDKRNRDDR